MSELMTEEQSVAYLKTNFRIRTDNKGLVLLRSIKEMLPKVDEQAQKKIGGIIIGFASFHNLSDRQLLKFFGVTLEAAKGAVGEAFLREHGFYRVLVASPYLSPTCKLFFNAWFAEAYDKYPMGCCLRRVGMDTFRLVSILPSGAEIEYPEDMTAAQVLEATNCPQDELQAMPVLQ